MSTEKLTELHTLIIDDLLATGGTVSCVADIVNSAVSADELQA